jgi:S1-C subfamily serine protease
MTMSNDTPDTEPDDSHAPFMQQGNEDTDESVATTMDDFTNTPNVPQEGTSAGVVTGATVAPEDTGEMEAVEPAEPVIAQETAPFDYDSYYADESAWVAAQAPASQPQATPKKSRDGILFFVGALAAAFLGAALTVGLLAASGTLTTEDAPPPTVATAAPAVIAEATVPPVIENRIVNELGAAVNPSAVAVKTVPSIVTVSTFDGEDNPFGSGSGVVLTADGYIATNEHVVDGATAWQITFEDGRVYSAELVGKDALTDLAVLKIEADNLVPIDLGSTEVLALGDPAVAVGNPLGQEGGSSVSVGIVSAFNRRVEFGDASALVGMIQTDAAINSGSSGGALVNSEGELIGITSAIGVSNAGPEGIGYAIPVEVVKRITDEIIEVGDVNHPFLGVTIGNHISDLPDGGIIPAGAEVISIEGTDSAAGQAGLLPSDIIIQIGEKDIVSQNDLILAVRLYRVGDEVEFVVLRDGEHQTFTVVMGQRPVEFGG